MSFRELTYSMLLLISPLALATQVTSGNVNPKIINGISTELNQIPWQVSLGQYSYCGGTIIAPQWVLTAAHCVVYKDGTVDSKVDIVAHAVDFTSSKNAKKYVGDHIVVHPEYNRNTHSNDIALIKLSDKNEFSINTWIKLLSKEEQSLMESQFVNEWVENQTRKANLLVSGWGGTDPTKPKESGTTFLQHTLLSGVPFEQCIALWNSLDSGSVGSFDKMIHVVCATSPEPELATDSCFGDSGGPLVWRNQNNTNDKDLGLRLAGVVSFGHKCGTRIPGVYTKVSDYIEWVESILGTSLDELSGSTFTHDPFKDDYSHAMNHSAVQPDYKEHFSRGSSGGSTSLSSLLLLTGFMFSRKKTKK
ncbi:Putative trypsin-like serine protease [Photobacterium marinum]|uniref:Putative trypsin-like serine protease n=1 Tax=Photobacterium marinum TaxID=1056511 RepID=L8JFU1_9GAMM|nr:serine protease [Photobacterium marinum]ELR66277.1 Putative trypsin-like serine protease [Photobacterium marinum]